jgi:hypothetical protein
MVRKSSFRNTLVWNRPRSVSGSAQNMSRCPVRASGRLTIAQQFTAGTRAREMQSVKRTTERRRQISNLSAVRFTDVFANAYLPNQSLGYYQPSAKDWAGKTFVQSQPKPPSAFPNSVLIPHHSSLFRLKSALGFCLLIFGSFHNFHS